MSLAHSSIHVRTSTAGLVWCFNKNKNNNNDDHDEDEDDDAHDDDNYVDKNIDDGEATLKCALDCKQEQQQQQQY